MLATTPAHLPLSEPRPRAALFAALVSRNGFGDGYRSVSYLVPVPESGTSCGLPSLTLSVTVRVAVCEPVALGVNVTAMVQLSLGASELGQ